MSSNEGHVNKLGVTPLRVAVAYLGQETNTFNPAQSTIEDFEAFGLYRGQEIFTNLANIGPIGGLLDALAETDRQVEVIPLIRAYAVAGGRLATETLKVLTAEMRDGLATAGDLDAIALMMHGACAAENVDDVEGHLLRSARDIVGETMPIIVGLDHHANITQQMVKLSTAIVGHRTQPHVPYETGQLCGDLTLRTAGGEVTPRMAWRKIPLLSHQEQYLTDRGPMKAWFERAREIEEMQEVLYVSPFPMQPWLDVEEGGWAVAVVTDDDPQLAGRLVEEMAEIAWSMRSEFQTSTSLAPTTAIDKATSLPGLTILSDTGDSVFGGAGGDSTVLLAELLNNSDTKSLVPLVDPPTARALASADHLTKTEIEIGGTVTGWFEPVRINATLRAVNRCILHPGGSYDSDAVDMGITAHVDVGNVTILISERPGVAGNHPALYEHFGIDPEQYDIVVLKTASNFQWYAHLASDVIRVDTAGPTQTDIQTLPWERIPRPIFPLDEISTLVKA